MKLRFETGLEKRSQADPFIFADGGRYYMYVTGGRGIEAYSADDVFGEWKFEGDIGSVPGGDRYWAPSIIKYEGMYYIYTSCVVGNEFEFMYVLRSESPLGPFTDPKKLYNHFSIDTHVVQTDAGLFLWYAANNVNTDRIGTRIFVDRLIDPYTPAYEPREVIVPSFEEEIFEHHRKADGRDWYCLEGPFWFEEDGWQYVMYSAACFKNDTYHIGYATAKTDEQDLTKVDFVKHTVDGKFDPVMVKNEYEEGVGHHSVIKLDGQYYAVYHGRDWDMAVGSDHTLPRTARICKLHVKDGIITAERYRDHI